MERTMTDATLSDSAEDDDEIEETGSELSLERQTSQHNFLMASANLRKEDPAWVAEVNDVVTKQMQFSGEKQALSQLLKGLEDEQFVIPPFQRPYVWQVGTVKGLLHGIYDYFKMGKTFYYVGNIFIWYNGTKHQTEKRKVLDGQQRLTTLTLVLSILCILLREHNGKKHTDEIKKKIKVLENFLIANKEEKKCRLCPKGATLQAFFNHLPTIASRDELQTKLNELKSDRHSRFEQTIDKAATAILEFLDGDESNHIGSDPVELAKFVTHLQDNVYFSHTWIENVPDKYESIALDFFLRVNQNGTVLSETDTLKASLLCWVVDSEDKREEHARVWDCIETRLKTYQIDKKEDERAHEMEGTLNAFNFLFQILMGAACSLDMTEDNRKFESTVREHITRHTQTTEGVNRMMSLIECYGAAYMMVLESLGEIPPSLKSFVLEPRHQAGEDLFNDDTEKYRFLISIGKLHWFCDSVHKRFWHPVAVTLLATFIQMDKETRRTQGKHFLERLENLLAWSLFFTLTKDPGWVGQTFRETKTQMIKAIMGAGGYLEVPVAPDFNSGAMKEAFLSKFPGEKAGKGSAKGKGKGKAETEKEAAETQRPSKKRKVEPTAVRDEKSLRNLVDNLEYGPGSKLIQCKVTLLLYEMALKQEKTNLDANGYRELHQHLQLLDGLSRDMSSNVINTKGQRAQIEHILPVLANEDEEKNSPWTSDKKFVFDYDGVPDTEVVSIKQCKDYATSRQTRAIYEKCIGNLVLIPAKKAKTDKNLTFSFKERQWRGPDKRLDGSTIVDQLLSFTSLKRFSEPGELLVRGKIVEDDELYTVQEIGPRSYPKVKLYEAGLGETPKEKEPPKKRRAAVETVYHFGGRRWTTKANLERKADIVKKVVPSFKFGAE